MKKILFLLALVACGASAQETGMTTVIFDEAPAHKVVTWAEGPFSVPKEAEAVGSLSLRPYNGFVELVFMKGAVTDVKFLLRGGDTVKVTYDETGYPHVSSQTDPSFDKAYNFPASAGRLQVSPDIYAFDKFRTLRGAPSQLVPSVVEHLSAYRNNFMAALKKAKMPEEYKNYYGNSYFAPAEMVFDDTLVPYISNRQWLTTYKDALLFDLMKEQGGRIRKNERQTTPLFDRVAAEDITPVSKAVILRELLGSGMMNYESAETMEEYASKYVELTGDVSMSPNPLAYATDVLNLEDAEGNTTTLAALLEQNKGKVVYVDFWASWCGQCLMAMPAGKELREQRPDVAFIYISIDNDHNAWLFQHKRLALPSSYRILNFAASEFIQSLNLKGVPRYLIFDREGKMVNSQAPGPKSIGNKLDI